MTHTLHTQPRETLSQGAESIMLADGTLWSHAATLGTRTKESPFTIDRATIDNFTRLFSSVPGFRKVPVDYEHSTVNGATASGQPIPRAGTVLDLKGVYAASDFTGELRTAAEKLAKANGRTLDDSRNFGLWAQWKPTARALQYIQAGEITEMSIAFGDDMPDNVTGNPQGPGLISIALTNLPFLDDMLPVAASQAINTPDSRGENMTTPNTNSRVLAAVAALVGTAVVSDDDAVTALSAHQPEVVRLRTFSREIGEAIGEPDQAKALTKVKTLAADVTRYQSEAAAAKKAAIKTAVETYLTKHEKRFTVPVRKMFSAALTKELEDGKEGAKPEDTETAKAVESLPETGITDQVSAGDKGDKAEDDVKLDQKARELMQSNPKLKKLSENDEPAAYLEALVLAERELKLPRRIA